MQDASQDLRDRASRHWAAVNAMKEAAEAVGSGDMSLLDANDAKHEILKTLRGLDNTVITDLLAEITRLEQAATPSQARQLLEAELREQTAENERLRQHAAKLATAHECLRRDLHEANVAKEGLRKRVFHLQSLHGHEAAPQPLYAPPTPATDPFTLAAGHALERAQRRLFEDAGRRAIDMLPHYRAVLHDLTRPQPKTPAQLKAEREEDLADKINKLQAGGEALGC